MYIGYFAISNLMLLREDFGLEPRFSVACPQDRLSSSL